MGDFLDLGLGDLANLLTVGFTRTTFNADSLLDEGRNRRNLRDEGKALVRINRNDDRHDHALVILGLCVKLLAELHDVHALLTEGGTYRRSRVGSACGDLKLDITCDFLCHCFISVAKTVPLSGGGLDLIIGKFNRCRATEHSNHDPNLGHVCHKFVYDAHKVLERTFLDADIFANLVRDLDLTFRRILRTNSKKGIDLALL